PPPPAPPVTAISTPGNGSTVQGTVSVQGTVTAQAGLSQVQFLVDGNVAATGYSSPFSFSWNSAGVANGSHTLSVKGYDTPNHRTQASVAVTVNNVAPPPPPPPTDTQPPSVYVQSPINGQIITANNIFVAVNATDNVRVTQVSIYVDGVQYYSGTASPYVFNL